MGGAPPVCNLYLMPPLLRSSVSALSLARAYIRFLSGDFSRKPFTEWVIGLFGRLLRVYGWAAKLYTNCAPTATLTCADPAPDYGGEYFGINGVYRNIIPQKGARGGGQPEWRGGEGLVNSWCIVWRPNHTPTID